MLFKIRNQLFNLNRRSFLRLLLSSASIAFLPKNSFSKQSEYITNDILVRFQKWSHVATGYLDITLDETRNYAEFCLKNGIKETDFSELETDVYRGTALEKKLLEGWMTGLVHMYGEELNRHYDTILMWRTAGLDKKPLSCQKNHHSWNLPPFAK